MSPLAEPKEALCICLVNDEDLGATEVLTELLETQTWLVEGIKSKEILAVRKYPKSSKPAGDSVGTLCTQKLLCAKVSKSYQAQRKTHSQLPGACHRASLLFTQLF